MQVFEYSGRDFDPYGDEDHAAATAPGAWQTPTAHAPLSATLQLPGSKSLTNRELVLAALADGPSLLRAPLHSRDTSLMIEALRALGVSIEQVTGEGQFGPDLLVTPPDELIGSSSIDCGLAGTVMRFLPPVAALALGPVSFDGDEAARHRPMRATLQALRDLGVDVSDDGRGSLPFSLFGTGSVRGGELSMDASASSQFVSGLLLAAPRFEEGLTLRHTGATLPSRAHIEMTIHALAARGVTVRTPEVGVWIVEPQPIRALDVDIEPDLSNAAPFLAAAVVTGGSVTITGWPESTTQVGADLADLLPLFGATVSKDGDRLTVTGPERIRPITIDLSTGGELVPAIAAIAAFADGPSEITGIGHIRHHETDRLAALAAELGGLGARVTELDDGLAFEPAPLHGGLWHSHDDHRMATTGALVGLVVPGVEIDDIATTAKTLPEFVELWTRMRHPVAIDPLHWPSV
jgi:3-phosphoshikimate 1-carboxyvinyltransferase